MIPWLKRLESQTRFDMAVSFCFTTSGTPPVCAQTEKDFFFPPPSLVQTHRKLSRAIKVLRHSSPAVFGVENPGILASKEWGPAKEAMGEATRRVLPSDQVRPWDGQRLVLRLLANRRGGWS